MARRQIGGSRPQTQPQPRRVCNITRVELDSAPRGVDIQPFPQEKKRSLDGGTSFLLNRTNTDDGRLTWK